MTTQRYRTPVSERTAKEGLREYGAEVDAWELRYGRSSADMLDAVERGEVEETWDICEWLFAWRSLLDLKASTGRPDGVRLTAPGAVDNCACEDGGCEDSGPSLRELAEAGA